MKLIAGGSGIQGLVVVPFLRVFDGKLLTNGIGGFFAILKEKFGEEEALDRTLKFIKRFERTLRVMDRCGICDERIPRWRVKMIAYEYCVMWAGKLYLNLWEEMEDLLEGLHGDTEIEVEVLDLEEGRVKLLKGNAKKKAKGCVAFLGLFPPLDGRYITTTYYSQIPITFAQKGDVVLLNLNDPSKCDVRVVDEVLTQVSEIRSHYLVKKIIAERPLKVIKAPTFSWKYLKDLEEHFKEYEKIFTSHLENEKAPI